MSHRAVAFLPPGPHEDRQWRQIARYCEAHTYAITTRTDSTEACVRLVVDGLADLVVAATDPRNGLRAAVLAVGGAFEVAREPPRRPPTLADWLRRALGRGVTPRQIGKAVGEDTTDVSRIMRELGIDRPDEPK